MTSGTTITLSVPDDVRGEIEKTVERTGRDAASVAAEMLAEAVKMRRVPGITFVDGAAGRVPVIAGTGLEVFEIVGPYRAMGENVERLRQAFHWLTEQQIRAALDYAAAYPDEVDARLRDDERWTADSTYAAYPFMRLDR